MSKNICSRLITRTNSVRTRQYLWSGSEAGEVRVIPVCSLSVFLCHFSSLDCKGVCSSGQAIRNVTSVHAPHIFSRKRCRMHQMARNTWSKGLYTHVLGISFSSVRTHHGADRLTKYLSYPHSAQDRDYPNVPMLIKYPAYPDDISMAGSGRTIWCRLAPISMTFA